MEPGARIQEPAGHGIDEQNRGITHAGGRRRKLGTLHGLRLLAPRFWLLAPLFYCP